MVEQSRLDCYPTGGPRPNIQPARKARDWMDNTRDRFAYRCLPLAIANRVGWEIINPVSFTAVWTGSDDVRGLIIQPEGDGCIASSHFGHGILTFSVGGLFRTSENVQLWVGGSPNEVKDSIQPLTGIVETDWSHMTFTMNWKFTRKHETIRFEKDEPFCFIMPMQVGLLEDLEPRFNSFQTDTDLCLKYYGWSDKREMFNNDLQTRSDPVMGKDSWQKTYHRTADRTKIRLKGFKDA